MNNIFKYLEIKKGRPIPLQYKLKNKMPLTKDDLYIEGDLDLWFSDYFLLPDDLTVNGSLDLYFSNMKTLPNNLTVNGCLYLELTNISDLPDSLNVEGNLFCRSTPLAKNFKTDLSLLTKYQKQIKGHIIHE